MNITYNKNEHLKLIKKRSLLREKSMYLDSEKSGKLRKYSILVSGKLNWYLREIYLEVLKDLRTEKVIFMAFCWTFRTIERSASDLSAVLQENLILLSPTETSINFQELLDKVADTVYDCIDNPELLTTEDKVRLSNKMKEIEIQIQNL